jgi:FkbM family methyltransferase
VRALLKQLQSVPAFNAPVTKAVPAAMRAVGRDSELAIKHLPRVGMTEMTLPDGRRARLWSRGDDWVSNQVFWRGWDGFQSEVTPLFWRLAKRARVTFDIGAHVGFYTVLAAAANRSAAVYAFEPLPAVLERLQRNIFLNQPLNVVALGEAVGRADGEAEFFHVPGLIPCSSSLSGTFMGGTPGLQSIPVNVVRLDTFAAEHGLTKVDLMKLDTETTEPDVLTGMGRLLRESRPDIVCEVLPSADADALTTILQPLGYWFYLLTDTGPRRHDRVTANLQWPNHLFTPARLEARE